MAEEGQRPRLPFSIENILREDFPNPSKISKRPFINPDTYRVFTRPTNPCQDCFTIRYGPPFPVYHQENSLKSAGSHVTLPMNLTPMARSCNKVENNGMQARGQSNFKGNKITEGRVESSVAARSTTKQDRSRNESATKPSEKKKRYRSHFSQVQLQYLESIFSRQHYLSRDERTLLAATLDMTELQVRNWFQNKRYQKRHREIQALQKLSKKVPVTVLVNDGGGTSTVSVNQSTTNMGNIGQTPQQKVN